MRKSRRIAAFLMLSSSKTEEVSQNSFIFTLAGRQIDRSTTTTAIARIRPHRRCLGRDRPDGTRKRLQVYLGGGAFFRPKPPVFDRS